MANNSDFKRPFSDLFELLPDVFRSETNEGVFRNVFNRFLSKPEIERVNGLIGQPTGATQDRRLVEPTPHRQAFQLQPLLFSRIGSENFITSYVDVLNELERLGVTICRQPLWGNSLKFNWIPPVDIDKIINFRNYFWVDPINPAASPQYLTIKNPCKQAEQLVAGYQETLDTFGEEFSIEGIDTTNNTLTINGDITKVFTEGFVFLVRESSNADINQKNFTTISSEYNSDNDETTIFVEENITLSTPDDGVISIAELMFVFVAEQNCLCGGDVGWDQAPWDDNDIGAVLWTDGLLTAISWDTEAEWIIANGAPAQDDIWYDTTTNELKQYDGGVWVVVQQNFSALVDLVEGTHFWDFTEGCSFEDNQWIQQNKWVHQNNVTNFAIAKQATQPILEYDARLQLNKWNCTQYVWEYRQSQFTDFADTTGEPHLNELIPFDYVIDGGLTEIALSPLHGDQTGIFVPGYKFRILGDTTDPANDGIYTVSSSLFNNNQTTVQIDGTFTSPTASFLSNGVVTPDSTSQGDPWRLYDEHWRLIDQIEPVPVTPRVDNPIIEIDDLGTPIVLPGIGEYLTSEEVDPVLFEGPGNEYIYAMEITVTNPGGVTTGTPFTFDTRMQQRARTGQNDLRVFVDGIRQYGLFDEVDTGGFVSGIVFDYDIPQNVVVLIEAGPPGLEDIGKASIDVLTPTGIVTQSLIQYRRSEQVKTEVNQYPLFDIVNVDGTDAFMANHIFGYLESQDAPIDADTGIRIVITEDTNYHFEQLILEEDNGKMFAFILNGEPQTIWRKGNNDEEYIPQYVDANRNPVSVGDPNGFWEIPDQLFFNAEHENRKELTFRELFSHFNSIINEQANIPGFILPGDTFYLLTDPNYGLGGKIKEHNDSYDTMLSSTYINNVTPLGVIDFAHDAYLNSLNVLKELYRNNLVDFLTNTSLDYIQDLSGEITDNVITRYETNNDLALIYGDSNTYDPVLDVGVRNWPATLPFIRMAFKTAPNVVEDDTLGLRFLLHHDGHYSTPSLTTTTKESVIQTTINRLDQRVSPAEPFGQQSTLAPPSTFIALQTETTPRSGVYWYQVVSGTRTLYRFNVINVSMTAPVGVDPGAYWYDTSTDTLRQLSAMLVWNPVTVVGDGVITAAWEEVNLDDLLTDILLEIETRLYQTAPDLDQLAFDVSTLPSSTLSCPDTDAVTTEEDTYTTLLREAFGSWLSDQEITDPFSSSSFYDPLDPFTWNYKQSLITTFPSSLNTGTESGGWWKDLYFKLYRTPYPHLEPWKLQGYDQKPSWWDAEYLDTIGSRRWIYDHATTTGMWENIRVGQVPTGQLLPNGAVSTGVAGEVGATYLYFSVNIDDSTIDGFDPDDLFPPFWDHIANGGSAVVRSVIPSFGSVVNPSADYQFGDRGPVEFDWIQTAQRLYDDLTVGFKMQPVKFIHNTFGEQFIEVGGLQVNEDLQKVYSHKDVRFHGDIINTNELLQFEGINQWYVNFNRASGFDLTASNFRPLWQNWSPLLSYQFGSVIDTATFQIDNPNFDLNRRDFRIALKKSVGIDNKTYESLKVSVLGIPNRLVSSDTESLWSFQLDTFSPIKRTLQYYNIKNYPFNTDTLNNTFTLHQFNIVDIDQAGGVFTVSGNQTESFILSNDFGVTKSTGNNGSYTATSVVYDSVQNVTHISVAGPLLNPVADGVLTAQYRQLPWETGDAIELTSTVGLPSPLRTNVPYYIIKLTPTMFQLARTRNDAITKTPINIQSKGSGLHKVGEVDYKFNVFNGNSSNDRVWIHYKLDKESVLSVTPPSPLRGIQNLINVVDGYAEFERDEGFVFNVDGTEIDSDLNKPISWQTEVERFLDSIFRIRSFRQEQSEQFNVNVNPLDDELVFANEQPNWVTGQKVQIFAYDGVAPVPLVQQSPYYVIREDADRVQLALTRTGALLGNAIDIMTTGSGRVFLQEYVAGKRTIEVFELNPSRNNLWIDHPMGILSDVDVGSVVDIRNTQLITDQNGEKLTTEQLAVFRQDKQSRLFVQNSKPNPRKPTAGQNPQRDWRHISTANIFIDGVEHAIMFNDNSVEGFLIYDPFLGLNTRFFDVLFFRQDEFTQRPVVGGYFLTEDEELLRNIESSVVDLQNAYDTYQTLETTNLTIEGRRSLGYEGTNTQSYLTELNVSPKTQFAFWRGFIQSKGSTVGIDAYVNSAAFGGAEVDEYWAFKVAEFGSAYEKEFISLNLTERDGQRVEKRFEFLDPTMDRVDADPTFEGVFITDEDRWFEQPDQRLKLSDNNDTLYFEAEITDVEVLPAQSTPFYHETSSPFERVEVLEIDGSGNLVGSVTHNVINSKLIEITQNIGGGNEYRIYTINPAQQKFNPANIIDEQSDIVIQDVMLWDPRRGHQYHNAFNVVTIQQDQDPASYTNSPDPSLISSEFWVEPEVGEVWWNTAALEYVPYHDSTIFNLESRSQNWGRLSDWAEVQLFQWTESDVPPEEWNAQAAVEGTDITIDPRVRKSGTVKSDTYRRERTTFSIDSFEVSNAPSDANTIFVNDPTGDFQVGDRVVFTTTNSLPIPLQNGTFYFITFAGTPGPTRPIRVSLTEGGPDVQIQPGSLIIDIGGLASNLATPTNLLNNFGENNFQEAQYGVALTSGTATNYLTGTNGTGTVIFTPGNGKSFADQTYVTSAFGSGASVLVGDAGAGLGNDTFVINSEDGPNKAHHTEVEVDGFVANVRIIPSSSPAYPGAGAYTYSMLAADLQAQINQQLSARNASVTVTIEAGVGVRITSDQAIVGGYVNTRTGDPGFDTGDTDRNIWRTLSRGGGGVLGPRKIATPQAGAPISEFDGVVTIDGTTILPVSVTADQVPTYQDLLDQINTQIGTFGTASLIGGNLVVTAASTGTSSTVTLTGDIFTSLVDFDNFSSTAGTSFVYGAEFTINGTNVQTVTFDGEAAPTVSDVISIINSQLNGAFADIDGSNIDVQSTTIGVNSSISIVEPVGGTLPMFNDMITGQFTGFGTSTIGTEPQQYTVDVITGDQTQNVIVTGNQVQTYGELFNAINDDISVGEMIINADGNFQIINGTQQVSINNDQLFVFLSTTTPVIPPALPPSPAVNDIFNIDTGSGSHNIVPAFQEDWTQLQRQVKRLIAARDDLGGNTYDATIGTAPNAIEAGDRVDVYVNGFLTLENEQVNGAGEVTVPTANPQDFITIVKDIVPLTAEEANFDPEEFDDGSVLVERKELNSYTIRNIVNEFGQTDQRFYFWVEDKTTRVGNNPSLITAERELTTIPQPYIVLDKLIDEGVSASGTPVPELPLRYTQAIIRGLAGIINDNRLTIRFTRDFTLRNSLEPRNYPADLPADFSRVKQEPLDLKNLHTEWTLLREGQPFKVPRNLWDKIIEAVIGRKLDNPSVRVPSLDRELYDLRNDTQTQYGFGDGQAFVNGQLALDTVLDDLQNPNNNFAPIDVNAFFATHDTETEAGLIEFFDDLYNTFTVTDVNRIYFSVLLDALTTKDEYPDLFKTSWVALEGTQVLQTEALING